MGAYNFLILQVVRFRFISALIIDIIAYATKASAQNISFIIHQITMNGIRSGHAMANQKESPDILGGFPLEELLTTKAHMALSIFLLYQQGGIYVN